MSDVVERIARAIHQETGERHLKWESLGDLRDDFRDMARAALDALAESVTDEMIQSARVAAKAGESDEITAIWRTGIRAAILAAKG